LFFFSDRKPHQFIYKRNLLQGKQISGHFSGQYSLLSVKTMFPALSFINIPGLPFIIVVAAGV
jgi:hypothetical protein